MNNKLILIIAFIVLCGAQIYFPAKVVLENEGVLKQGKAWKFECRPIDPNDPLRGKYITLSFEAERFETSDTTEYERREPVFVSLKEGADGFAEVDYISRTMPEGLDYFSASVLSAYRKRHNQLDSPFEVRIDFPFDRYYMEESKAKQAEDAYRNARRDDKLSVYALVKVKSGTAVLDNVFIEDEPIKEYVKRELEKEAKEPVDPSEE